MNEKERYALEWSTSADYFIENNSYNILTKSIKEYHTILEIGCGTGQSTLSLLKEGHSVIAIEQNSYCIIKAKEIIQAAGYNICESIENISKNSVCFLEYDITNPDFLDSILPKLEFDIVLCWNMGTYWDKEKTENIVPKMLAYGLTINQIRENFESSYSELIIWYACKIAKQKKCAVNIVDRGVHKITRLNDPYYYRLKNEFYFSKIEYKNIKSTTISTGGTQLITRGRVNTEHILPIVFVSILMK